MRLTPYIKIVRLLHLFLFTAMFFVTWSYGVKAQEIRPAALILTENFQEQSLSPYLKKHNTVISSDDISPVLRAHRLDAASYISNSNLRGSIIPLGYDGKPLWISFEIINKSTKEQWHLDLGHYFNGRFGFLKNITVLVTNFDEQVLYQETISGTQQNNFIPLILPPNKRSIIAVGITGHAGIPTTIPLKIVSKETIKHLKNSRKNMQTYVLFGLIGMTFFFLSMCVSQMSSAYTFFSAYYIILCLTVLLENQLFFFIPFLSPFILPMLVMLLSMSGLIIVKMLWDEIAESEVINTLFKGLSILLIALPVAGALLPAEMSFIKVCLYFSASLATIVIIPIASIMQSRYANQDSMSFVFGWFVLLCGFSISSAAIASVIPPLTTTINALWYALIPQALFFIYALRIKTRNEENSVHQAKTMEIVENNSVSKFRQSKELAEQERLMQVIEQERKVLGELRKSEARRAEEMRVEKERADDANRAKSAFLAVVSHEIRTPMSGIMGMVRMLLDSGLDKKQKEYAQTIQESSDAMLALLNDILDFEKVEQGKMDIENIGFDLPRLMRGVATLMNGHAAQKNIELITEIDSKLPKYVKGDPTRLRQILLNLTGNAIKFTEVGRVTIIAKLIKEGHDDQPHEVYLGVSDSGVGISKEGQQKIFDAFSQADKSVNRKFGGTGLGLAISKGLVESMGSNIHINSNEGEGSTFFFTIDMEASLSEEKSPTNQTKKIYEHHKKPMNILIVEDNSVNVKVLKGFLERSPHKLDTATTAEDCLTKLGITQYDLILMDIELPGMNGDEATQKIRTDKDPKISKTPIIALSGNVLKEDVQKYLDAGMNDTLEKPLNADRLNQALDNVIKQQRETTKDVQEQTDVPSIFSKERTQSKESIAPKDASEKPLIQNITKPKTAPTRVARASKKVSKPLAPLSDPEVSKPVTSESNTPAFDTSTLDALKGHLEPAQIQEMLDEVFTKSEEIMASLKQAIENNDAKEAYARGHELKGMTGNFGLTQISDIATQIEAQAKAEDLSNIDALIAQMPTALTNARAAADEWLKI